MDINLCYSLKCNTINFKERNLRQHVNALSFISDDAKVWVYQANRSFTQDEIEKSVKL